jgi:DNA-binding transcriptional LysR family regulator
MERVSIVEIRQLVQFVAVAELRNFRRAAERLHMAQPPLSQAIRRLERELDARLFNRTSRAVELTDAGRVLLLESRRILSHVEAAVGATQRTAQGRLGKLSVGFTVPWSYELVPAVLREFVTRFPGVSLAVRELSSSEQVRLLIEGDLDFGFLRLPAHFDAKGLETITLREDALTVVVPRGHPMAAVKSLSLAQLRDEPFVLPAYGVGQGMEQFSFRMQVANLCAEARFVPRVVQEASLMQTIVHLVETGLGISLVPGWTRSHFSSRAVYVPLATQSHRARVTLALAWAKANGSPIVEHFCAAVRDVNERHRDARRPLRRAQ